MTIKISGKGRPGSYVLLIGLFLLAWLYIAIPKDIRSSELTWSSTTRDLHMPMRKDERPKIRVAAFIGVMTGFTTAKEKQYNYELRRTALRSTWFPATVEDGQRLQQQGIAVKFVIGHSSVPNQEDVVSKEQELHGNFLRLPIQERYGGLPNKVLVLLHTVLQLYELDYLFKVDDDVYLRIDRVLPAVQQWKEGHADYIGCMKQGPVYKDSKYRWFEPQHAVIGDHYFTHCWGSAYVLSSKAVAAIAAVPKYHLRFFENEDVTIGSWMLAFNVTHCDDRRLCEPRCSATSLVVYDYPQCAGLCHPSEQLIELHQSQPCRVPPVDEAGIIGKTKPFFWFHPVPSLPES